MRTLLSILLLTLLFPANVWAHTGLERSNPANNQTVTEPLTEITLEFEDNIEKLSTFTLSGSQGNRVPAEISVNHKVMTGKLAQPLPNDSYTLDWKVTSEDGHNLQGKLAFTVQVAVTASPNAVTPVPATAQASVSPTPSSDAASPNPAASAGSGITQPAKAIDDGNAKEAASYTIPIIIGAVVLIGLVALVAARRSSRK